MLRLSPKTQLFDEKPLVLATGASAKRTGPKASS